MRCYGIWNMWFPWADTNCNSSLWWRSLAQPRSSIAVPILSDDVSDVGRNHTLNTTCPQNPQTVKTQELMGSDEDSTRDNINNYNFRISQIWIKLGNPSPCAPLLRPLCMALLRKSTNPIFWELPQSQEPQAPDLWQYRRKTSTQNLSKKRLWSGARSLRSVRSCGMILWDHQHFTRSLGSRSLSYCMCYIGTQKRSGGHEVMFVLHLPCKIDVHVPCLSTWNNASTMRHTRGTTITSSRPNQPMPRKAAQLNHIDRCDRTLHTLPATPSPPPRSLENYFVEKYLKRM